jgi:hypothetical protein
MHVSYKSAEIVEQRRAKADDVVKRSEFRKAHGLEDEEKQGWFGSWTAREDGGRRTVPREVLRNPDAVSAASGDEGKKKVEERVVVPPTEAEKKRSDDVFVAFDGTVQTERKKWFGLF